MITKEVTTQGLFYDGKSPVGQQATLMVSGSQVRLCCGETEKTYNTNSLLVSPKSGGADRFICFADGGQYQCNNLQVLDTLPQEGATENIVAWLEKHISAAIASIVLVIVSLGLGYFYGLPVLADRVVEKIPMETESHLGDYILSWLDENVMRASEIDTVKRYRLVQEFTELHKELLSSAHIKLHFRNGHAVGANAFALPGGNIVITDQLIDLAASDEEILAVLAHEAGHVERRHAMRNILQNSIVVLAVTSITSDVSMLGGTMASLPVLFLQAKYSRGFEEEADSFGVGLLEANAIPPQAFADILERLDEQHGFMPNEFSYLSTHPATSERVKKIRNPAASRVSSDTRQ